MNRRGVFGILTLSAVALLSPARLMTAAPAEEKTVTLHITGMT